MKKLVYIILLLVTTVGFSQSNPITYQAVIYLPSGQNAPGVDVTNLPMTNKNICLQFSFIDANNRVEYQEEIKVKTDEFGMVNITIGNGEQSGGYASSFDAIVWNALSQKNLQVALDATGLCNQFEALSNEPIASVPFANASITAGNVSGVVALVNGGTGATTAAGARANLGIGNVENTADLNKPMSTATKTYVDTAITSATIADASTTSKGKIQLAGDLAGTAGAPTVPGLALKENAENKSTTTTLGTSNVLFPTQNAVKTYVDTAIAGATIVDADANTKGKIQLTGDLGGTASAPTVPGLALKLDASLAGVPNGLATLNSAGIIPANQLPPISVASTNVVANQAQMLALSNATVGSIAVRTDVNKNFILSTAGPSVLANWIELLTPGAPVQSVNGLTGAIQLAKSDINLANVDNTSDAAKPISTATQNALNLKLNTNQVGVPNGTASLNALGKIPTSQIPAISFSSVKVLGSQAEMLALVDAVVGSVVIRTDVNKNYVLAQSNPQVLANWVELLTPAPPVQSVNGYVGSVALTKSDIGLSNADNTGDIDKPVSTATQTALDLKANLASPTFTGTVGGITKSMVGLANVDNTTDLNKPVSTATQSALDLKANLASPTFSGTVSGITKAMVGLGNVDNTTDLNKPISTATQTALDLKSNTADVTTSLALKEDVANKSTTTTLGTSDLLYPSQKAVKTYVDTAIAGATIVDADATTKGKLKLAGDLAGTADLPEVAAGAIATAKLAANAVTTAKITDANVTNAKLDKANIPLSGFGAATADVALGANKLTGVADPAAAQDAATKNYVDVAIAGATIADANATTKGKLKLAGDLAGTADSPEVAAGAIVTAKLAANAVTTAKITDANVTDAKLDKANIPLSGFGAATADVALGANKLTGVADPAAAQDAATKNYVDTAISSSSTTAVPYTGATGPVNLGAYNLTVNGMLIGRPANSFATQVQNTALGVGVMSSYLPTALAQDYNTGIGYYALNKLTTGARNTATGSTALYNLTTGNYNSAFGMDALSALTTGGYNTGIGIAAGKNIQTTSHNTMLGYYAGLGITGSNNIVIGSSILPTTGTGITTGSNNTIIGSGINSLTSTLSNNIVLADGQGNIRAQHNGSTGWTLGTIISGTWNAATIAIDKGGTGATTAADALTNLGAEPTANKSTATDLGNSAPSDLLFPSQKAVKAYVDSSVSSGAPDATTSTAGKIKLAGDLTGTAALPEVAAGAISSTKLAANAVTTVKIADASVTKVKLADDAVETVKIKDLNVTTDKLAANAVTTAKILDGTILVGDLADDAVETAKIKDANVTAAKLATDAVETLKIKDLNVTTDKLAANAVTTAKILDGTILVGDLADDAVETAKIKDANVTAAKLATDAVETLKIKDANVTAAKLATDAVETLKIKDGNVTNAKLDKTNIPLSGFGAAAANVDLGSNKLTNVTDPTTAQDAATKNYVDTATAGITTLADGKIYLGNASNVATEVTPSGDVTITNAGVTAIGTGKVVVGMLATDAVETIKIKDANVTEAKLAADAVTSAKITDGTIVVGDLADNAVETAKIKNANVTTAKLADDAVETAKIKDANVTTAKLADAAVTTAKITDANVTAAKLAADAVETAKIKDANVTTAKLSDAAVTTAKITDANVTAAKLAADAVTTAKITDANVTTAKLADAAVTTAKITDANVTAAKLAADAVETAKIKDAAVTSAKIKDGEIVNADVAASAAIAYSKLNLTGSIVAADLSASAVTNAKLDKANIPLSGFGAAAADVDLGSNKLTNVTDPTTAQDAATKNYVDTATSGITTLADGKIYLGNASNVATEVTPTGDVTMTNAGVTAIGTGKVVAGMLATDAVETAKIKDANVTTAKLADAAVTTAKITDANVTTAKLADAAVTTAKITDANVTTAKLADAAVTTAKITDANVTTDKLAANAVTTAKITDANVTTAKLADTAVTTAKITDAAITYAKIQNVSATDKILGRISTGAGVIEEIATTGSGNVVRATSPTLVTPVLGAATGTSLSVSGQLTSTVATGTAPLVVTSTTPVANLSIGGTAATATNIAGGAAGSIPYQTAAATTAMLAKGTDGQVLTLASGVPSWSTSNAVPYTGATGAVDLGAYDLKVNGLTVGRGNTGDGTNTAVGASALLTNTAGTDNTAVGYNALKTTTGSLNSAFGSLALKTNTSGTRNAAFGTMAIQANSTGTNNSGFGYGTLYATTASDNTGIGYLAGYNVTSGAKNIFIGSLAGNSISTASLANTTGLNSVLIGYDVRPLANADTNEIVLSGYNGTAGTVGLGSNTTLIGNSTTTNARIMGALNLPNATTSTSTTTGALTVGGGVGIVENLNVGGNVKITGTIEIDGGSPAAGKVLTSDANGVASWTYGSSSVSKPTATATILISDKYVFYDGTADGTLTLPTATGNAGKEIIIKNRTTKVVTISSSDTIFVDIANSAVTTFTIGSEASNNWVKVVSDGSKWVAFRALF